MRPELVITADGSPTLYVPEWNEHYHSTHGAVQESKHVFIDAGLKPALNLHDALQLLEIGLGTGFNALLTLDNIFDKPQTIFYDALEPYPPDEALLHAFTDRHLVALGNAAHYFHMLHALPWENTHNITPGFSLRKLRKTLADFTPDKRYHLIYFDAFSPRVQPELWMQENFNTLYRALHENGILVTYCAKGDVRRAMQSAGFVVERLPGPPGKREMLRALKK